MKKILLLLIFIFSISLASAVTPSNLEVYELGDDGFVIGWQTDEAATSQILYGTSGRLGQQTIQTTQRTTDHVVQVDDLNDNTVYFFRATGITAQGQTYSTVIGVTRTSQSQTTIPSDTAFYIGSALDGTRVDDITGTISIDAYPTSTLIYETSRNPNYVEFEVGENTYRENGAPWGIKAYFDDWVYQDTHTITARLYGDSGLLETDQITLSFSDYDVEDQPDPQPIPDPEPDPIPPSTDGKLKAFPSAYGGGSEVSGGRGGVLVKVNTLDLDAPLVYHRARNGQDEYYTGGLKDALEDNIGARTIIFDVSGNIIGDGTRINPRNQQDHSILGQSAPRGGITIHNTWLRYDNSANIIIRYMRSRPGIIQGDPIGDDSSTSAFNIWASPLIMDHVSASWGGDKAITAGCYRPCHLIDTTVQNSIAADSATLGVSSQGSTEELFDGNGNITWVYNLFAGVHRNPNMGGFNGYGEIQNNVAQNRGSRMVNIVRGYPNINHIGNWYRHYTTTYVKNVINDHSFVEPRIYTANNYYETNRGVQLRGLSSENNRVFWAHHRDYSKPLPDRMFLSDSLYGVIKNPAPLLTAQEAYEKAASGDVGANKYIDDAGRVQFYHDSYDAQVIENLNNDVMPFRKFSSDWDLPNLPTNRRPSSYDTDNDGMSDAWERRTFGDLDESYRGDHDGDGYTNIEEFLNQVDFATR